MSIAAKSLKTPELPSKTKTQIARFFWRTASVPITTLWMVCGYFITPAQAQGTYENTSGGLINDSATFCTSPLVRTFSVTDSFTITDVNLGLNIKHSFRGDIQVTLSHPDGTSVEVISAAFDSQSDYDVLLDSDSSNPLDDSDPDDTSAPIYDRTVAPSNSLDTFDGKPSAGTWSLEVCDDGSGDNGVFNVAELALNGATPSPSPTIGNSQADVGEVGIFTRADAAGTGGLPLYIEVDGEELGPCFCSNKALALPDGGLTEFTVSDIITVTNGDFGDGTNASDDLLDKVARTLAGLANGFSLTDIQNTVWFYTDGDPSGNTTLINNVDTGTYDPVTITFLRAPLVNGTQEVQNFTCFDSTPATTVTTNSPDVELVKRITAINGNRVENTNDTPPTALNAVVNDGVANSADDESNWPLGYLLGELDAGYVKPGDEIEYTVYFLNSGTAAAADVRICDWIQPNQSFVTDAYGVGNDIELVIDGTTYNLTAAVDAADRTEVATVGSLPTGPDCNLSGSANAGDSVVVMDVTGTTGNPTGLSTFPNTTGQGTPNNAYGYFRFTTKVDE